VAHLSTLQGRRNNRGAVSARSKARAPADRRGSFFSGCRLSATFTPPPAKSGHRDCQAPGFASRVITIIAATKNGDDPAARRDADRRAACIWLAPADEEYRSIRRECTDHMIVVNEEHLRRILGKFAIYYNHVRTHTSLAKDAPYTRPIERFGHVVARPILGGLHHRYARI
jgi:hypothetical protein